MSEEYDAVEQHQLRYQMNPKRRALRALFNVDTSLRKWQPQTTARSLSPSLLRFLPYTRLFAPVFHSTCWVQLFALCVILSGASGIASDVSTLEIEGKVTSKAYNPYTGAMYQLLSYDFTVTLAEDTWRICTIDNMATQGQRQSADRAELSFDGTDMYLLDHWSTNLIKESNARDRTDYVPEQALVTKNIFPYTSDPIQKMLWLAYCSRLYFRTFAGEQMPSLTDYVRTTNTLRVSYKQYSSTNPMLKGLSGFAPGTRLDVVNGKMVHVPCPAPFDKEYLAVRYEVEEVTNYEGEVFPVRFSATYFMPIQLAGKGATNSVVRVQQGSVTELNHNIIRDIRPQITSDAIIRDARFSRKATDPLFAYRETNRTWLVRGSATLNADIASKSRLQPTPIFQSETWIGPRRVLAIITMLTIFVAPAFFAVKRLRKGN